MAYAPSIMNERLGIKIMKNYNWTTIAKIRLELKVNLNSIWILTVL